MLKIIWRAMEIAGGVGIFLYGMNIMTQSLEKAAGDKMKRLIELCTGNRLLGVLSGMIVTAFIQSSSAATIMTVGFVNAGLMNLQQAAGVIIGANIGTTITAQLIAFNLEDIAPVMAGIGAIMYIISEKEISKNIANFFVGFGLLFTGIVFLKASMLEAGQSYILINILSGLNNSSVISYILLLVTGALITALVQSSSTVTGIMIAMASQNLLSLNMAVPLILGTNLGTTFTALLASAGTDINGKRAALIHVIFNISGIIIFILFLQKAEVSLVEFLSPGDITRQIANIHTTFNLFTAIILLPITDVIVKLAKRIAK